MRKPNSTPERVHVRSNNDVLQTLQALQRNRRQRNQRKEFLVEGVRAIKQAIACGWTFNALIHAEGRQLSDWANDVLARQPCAQHIVLSEALMTQLAERDDGSELLATIAMPADDPTRIDEALAAPHDAARVPLVLLLDRPASPGNLGSLIRSADALGAHGVLVSGHASDIYDGECLRASMGSLFALPVVRIHQAAVLHTWLAQFAARWPDLLRVGADERGPLRLDQADFQRPTLLLLGNETWGLSAAWRTSCDALVSIPMAGSASSLNLAVAGSILLYEIARQRRSHATAPPTHASP